MQITSNLLFTLGAGAALLGGGLRVASSFIPYQSSSAWQEMFYAGIDSLLLIATAAIYLKYADRLHLMGLFGAVLVGLGFASIIGPDPVQFGINFYQAGAAIIVIGIAIFSIQLLRARLLPLAAGFWLSAFAAALGVSATGLDWLILISGSLFGAGYICAGSSLWRTQSFVS